MKSKIMSMLLVCTLLIGMFSTVSVSAATPSISASKKTIYVGGIYQLTMKNGTGTVKWESDDESVAQVLPNGYVVGLKKGKTIITATYKNVAYACTITVKNPALNATSAKIHTGETYRLKMSGSNPTKWTTSDKKVATVDEGGLVTGISTGTATITVTCENGKSYKCKLTVKNYGLVVGDVIEFGKYEYDGNEYNGADTMTWTVLDVQDGKALILCDQLVDAVKYEVNYTRDCWEQSNLRTYMNSTFYNDAFSANEKKQIEETVVNADINPDKQSAIQGSATKDHVFALSVAEYKKYTCKEAISTTKEINNSSYAETWWMRTKYDSNYAGVIDGSSILTGGRDAAGNKRGVRPAMWITIE